MHLAEDEIQSLLDPELAVMLPRASRDHLAACTECRSRLSDAEADAAWVSERLRLLDHPVPKRSAREAMVGRSAPGWGRIAAGFLLFLALGGIAYAAPGSPLPRLLARVVGLVSPSRPAPRAAPVAPGAEASQPGIAVDPGERFTIEIIAGGLGTAVISLSDSPEIVVRASGGRTTFTSDVDRVTVRHSGDPARLEIMVPRSAPSVELKSGERRVWRKQGSQITSDVPMDAEGRYAVSLMPPAP